MLRPVATANTGPQTTAHCYTGAGRTPARYAAGMVAPDDLEARVAALESQMHELSGRVRASEQDAAAARVLAGGADRDVTEIRGEIRDFRQATTASFNAMREDLTDLRQQMNNGFAEVNNGFAEVDRGFAEMRGKFDATAAGLAQITTLLNTIITTQSDQPDDD